MSNRTHRTLDEWLELQQSVHPQSIDLGLARITKVARALGVDKARCPVITVGGTNGKGSVVAHSDALLRAMGFSTGVFTSPHLVRYNERICVNGAQVSDEDLVHAFDRIEAARGDTTLTYFEFSALAALLIFADRRVDVAVLEVGLGGRLDAVNMIDADVAVVTSIGLDHRDWLGDTLEGIGREKAGIFRAGRPAVLGTREMPDSVLDAIAEIGARKVVAEEAFSWAVHPQGWDYRGLEVTLEGLPPSALAGAIQYRNAATAIAAVESLGTGRPITAQAVSAALRDVRLPGRFHVVPGPVEWILDVCHNEPAAKVFAAHLAARPCSGRTLAVVGILGDKDIPAIGRVLHPLIDHWILCSNAEPRGISAEELARRLALGNASVELASSAQAGFEAARARAVPGDRVVACGGFHMVGSALEWLRIY
ncbi:MAG: bifunctional tetrahydrofolate synthase/dihydrofolate synthase [Steroidobacteraceae bacterium]|nr:bifunctional tetrahydrofolate synthase/dihydrofolate synthase [Steroidobacteraceae bacterium]